MRRAEPPLFLGRDSYRRRRVADAARVMPVLGALLLLLPLLWAPQDTPDHDTARGGLYLFAVWGGLIAAAFLLSRHLGPEPVLPPPEALPDAPPDVLPDVPPDAPPDAASDTPPAPPPERAATGGDAP